MSVNNQKDPSICVALKNGNFIFLVIFRKILLKKNEVNDFEPMLGIYPIYRVM